MFTELKRVNIIWTTQITLDIVKDEELLRLMKESGCEMVLIGFEYYNCEILHSMIELKTSRV